MKFKTSHIKSVHLKLLVFLADLLNGIVSLIVVLSTNDESSEAASNDESSEAASNNESSEAASDAAVAFFAIPGLLYIIVGIAHLLRFTCSKKCCQGVNKWWEHTQDILIFTAGLWYYFSDNFPGLVMEHGANLGFDQEMIDSVVMVQPVLIVVALALYRVVHLHEEKKSTHEEGQGTEIRMTELTESKDDSGEEEEIGPGSELNNNIHLLYVKVVELLVIMIEFDSWFTIAGTAAERLSGCPRVVTAFLWLLYVFLLVVYLVISSGTIIEFVRDLKKHQWHHIITNYAIAVFICLCLGFYLLGDNALPLRCAGGNGKGITIVRLIFLLIAGVIYVTLLVIGACKVK